MKQFISVKDVNEIDALIESALLYKKNPLKDESLGKGKRIGLLFFNPSMRTRLSTQIAAKNLEVRCFYYYFILKVYTQRAAKELLINMPSLRAALMFFTADIANTRSTIFSVSSGKWMCNASFSFSQFSTL